MYLRDAKQKIMDFETKLEDYKAKLLMSYEASPVVLVTRKNGHVNMFLRCCLFQKIVILKDFCIFSAHVNFLYCNFWYSRLNLVPIPWKGSNISSIITVAKLRLSLALTQLSLALLMSSLFPTYTKRLLL